MLAEDLAALEPHVPVLCTQGDIMTFSAVEIQIVPSRLSPELVKGTAMSPRSIGYTGTRFPLSSGLLRDWYGTFVLLEA